MCPPHPGHSGRGGRAARPAWQRAARGPQSRAAQLRSGPQDLRVGSPPAARGGRSGTLRAENPRSRCGGPVVTAGRHDPAGGDAPGSEVCALRGSGGGGGGLHLLGMCPWRSLCREGVRSPVLAAQEFSPGERRGRAPGREEAHTAASSVHLRPCPWPLGGCPESLPGSL